MARRLSDRSAGEASRISETPGAFRWGAPSPGNFVGGSYGDRPDAESDDRDLEVLGGACSGAGRLTGEYWPGVCGVFFP
jgi:hypothetical protein